MLSWHHCQIAGAKAWKPRDFVFRGCTVDTGRQCSYTSYYARIAGQHDIPYNSMPFCCTAFLPTSLTVNSVSHDPKQAMSSKTCSQTMTSPTPPTSARVPTGLPKPKNSQSMVASGSVGGGLPQSEPSQQGRSVITSNPSRWVRKRGQAPRPVKPASQASRQN